MKKLFLITILFIQTIQISTAQVVDTIYTIGGKPVQVLMLNEMSPAEIAYWNSYYTRWFPEATLLDNTSQLYNCHSYAWNLTDGGQTICWINDSIYYDDMPSQPNVSKYWTNDYYVQTTELGAQKIHYYNGDHSAVVSPTVNGMYESKWGAGPLMRHAPNYGPYSHMTDRHYYRHVVVDYGLVNCSNGYGTIGVNIAANYSATAPIDASTFIWVIETAKGDDAVELGRAIINSQSNSTINLTFTQVGLYEMYVYCYNPYNVLVGVYNFEPVVTL